MSWTRCAPFWIVRAHEKAECYTAISIWPSSNKKRALLWSVVATLRPVDISFRAMFLNVLFIAQYACKSSIICSTCALFIFQRPTVVHLPWRCKIFALQMVGCCLRFRERLKTSKLLWVLKIWIFQIEEHIHPERTGRPFREWLPTPSTRGSFFSVSSRFRSCWSHLVPNPPKSPINWKWRCHVSCTTVKLQEIQKRTEQNEYCNGTCTSSWLSSCGGITS